MTDEEKWHELAQTFREKLDALILFPSFEGGSIRTDRLDEYERLAFEVDAAKVDLDKFYKRCFGTSRG